MMLSPAVLHAFRAYDIRGVVGPGFDAVFAENFGRAYGTHLLQRKDACPPNSSGVVVARDCRLSSPSFHRALIRGLCSTGLNVVDLGAAPSPCLYFAVLHLKKTAGIMVTASHNPREYNGFKLWMGNEVSEERELEAVRKILEQGAYAEGAGTVTFWDMLPLYVEDVVRRFPSCRPFRVVLDGSSGVAGKICTRILRALGADVTELFCEPDGNFPHHPPDPMKEEHLAALRAAVLKSGADIGLGIDGDGDRLAVMDERGRLLMADEVLSLFARDLLSRHPGAVILGDVKCSDRLFADVIQHGGVPEMCPSGRSRIRAALHARGALLAGELSGHIFHRENWYGFDDAIYCAARLLSILSGIAQPLSALPGWPSSFATPEINLPCPDHIKSRVVDEARRWYEAHFPVNALDGVRIDFGKAWGLIRASNTSPSLSLRFEAERRERAELLRSEAEHRIGLWIEEALKGQEGSR